MSKDRKNCGAQIWRRITVPYGLFSEEIYDSITVTCTYSPGHDGKHGGWAKFLNGIETVDAVVKW